MKRQAQYGIVLSSNASIDYSVGSVVVKSTLTLDLKGPFVEDQCIVIDIADNAILTLTSSGGMNSLGALPANTSRAIVQHKAGVLSIELIKSTSPDSIKVDNKTELAAYDVVRIPTQALVLDDGDGKWAVYASYTLGVGSVATNWIKLSDEDAFKSELTASVIRGLYDADPASKVNTLNISNVSGLTTALADKASTTDMNNALADKASVASVSSKLSTADLITATTAGGTGSERFYLDAGTIKYG